MLKAYFSLIFSVLCGVLIFSAMVDAASAAKRNSPVAVSACREAYTYWLTANPWPMSSLTIGGRSYTRAQLITIMNGSTNDGSVLLARQLVAALLNYAKGSQVAVDIAAAQSWMTTNSIPSGLPYNLNKSKEPGKTGVTIANRLATFNADTTTACEYTGGLTPMNLGCHTELAQPNPTVPTNLAQTGKFVRTNIAFGGVVDFMQGAMILPGVASDPVLSRINTFINSNKTLFALTNPATDLQLVEIIDIDTNAAPSPFSVTPNARVRARFRRMIGSLPVDGSDLTFRVEKGVNMAEPGIRYVLGNLPVVASVANYALLTSTEAGNKLLALTGGTVGSVSSIIYNEGLAKTGCLGANRLAYKFQLNGVATGKKSVYVVDAGNAGILGGASDIFTAKNVDMYVKVGTNPTILMKSDNPPYTDPSFSSNPDYATFDNLLTGAYSYFSSSFSRDMYDNHGGKLDAFYAPGTSGTMPDFAFTQWTALPGLPPTLYVTEPYVLDPKIITHEFAHAVLKSQGYQYYVGSESGAIHEGMADLYSYWQAGEYFNSLRSAVDPYVYNGDLTDPHVAGNAIAHAAYSAARGGTTSSGVVIHQAGDKVLEQTFYEAGQTMPTSNFLQFIHSIHATALIHADDNTPINGTPVTYDNCGAMLNGFNMTGLSETDKDHDCITDSVDNCPNNYNPDQADSNLNGIGDVCEPPGEYYFDLQIFADGAQFGATETCSGSGMPTQPNTTSVYMASFRSVTSSGYMNVAPWVYQSGAPMPFYQEQHPTVAPWASATNLSLDYAINGLAVTFNVLAGALQPKYCRTDMLYPLYGAVVGSPAPVFSRTLDFSNITFTKTGSPGVIYKASAIRLQNADPGHIYFNVWIAPVAP